MEKSIYFDKHFEKFINNDISIRHYFKCKVAELKRDYPTVFTGVKPCGSKGALRKTTGIKLVNDEPETINKAKEILYNVYLLKQSPGQGRTLSDNFKVLKDDKLVEIMKDRSLTFGERCEKVNNIVKGVKESENQKTLSYKQIEQYIYRNYSDYKHIKTMKSGNVNEPQIIPESESQSEETKIIPESSEENQDSLAQTQPQPQTQTQTKGKFKEFKTDEIVKLIEHNTSKAAFKILYERFKDKYTETQIRNYIARYKSKI